MPAEEIVQIVAQAFFELVCYSAAKIMLPVVTFGRVHVEPVGKRPIKFRWHGVHRRPAGKIVLQADLGALAGLFMIASVVAIGTLAYIFLRH